VTITSTTRGIIVPQNFIPKLSVYVVLEIKRQRAQMFRCCTRLIGTTMTCERSRLIATRWLSANANTVVRHLSKNQHYWISHYEDDLYEVGVTEKFFKEVLPEGCVGSSGEFNFDIERVNVIADPKERTEMCKGNLLIPGRDTILIEIEWSSLKRSESDELYHAIWSNESGVLQIKRPVELDIANDSRDEMFQIHSYNFEYIGRSQTPPPSELTKIWLYKCKMKPSVLSSFRR